MASKNLIGKEPSPKDFLDKRLNQMYFGVKISPEIEFWDILKPEPFVNKIDTNLGLIFEANIPSNFKESFLRHWYLYQIATPLSMRRSLLDICYFPDNEEEIKNAYLDEYYEEMWHPFDEKLDENAAVISELEKKYPTDKIDGFFKFWKGSSSKSKKICSNILSRSVSHDQTC